MGMVWLDFDVELFQLADDVFMRGVMLEVKGVLGWLKVVAVAAAALYLAIDCYKGAFAKVNDDAYLAGFPACGLHDNASNFK